MQQSRNACVRLEPAALASDGGGQAAAPALVVVCGVCGSGKSSLGVALADALGVAFQDADPLHPPANVAKMSRGEPLDDADRAPWLDACRAWLRERTTGGGVLACSALRRAYRDVLRSAAAPGRVRFVYLDAGRDVASPAAVALDARLKARAATGSHFMPASLLASQYKALEPPDDDDNEGDGGGARDGGGERGGSAGARNGVLVLPVALPPAAALAAATAFMRASHPAAR